MEGDKKLNVEYVELDGKTLEFDAKKQTAKLWVGQEDYIKFSSKDLQDLLMFLMKHVDEGDEKDA